MTIRRASTAVVFVFALTLLHVAAAGTVAAAGQTTSPPSGTDAGLLAALMDEGQTVYGANCLECHGDGGAGPSLAHNTYVSNKDAVIKQVLEGSANGDMSEFASTLTDRQIAAVVTFVRNSSDNAFGIALESDVKRLRDEMAKKP